MLPLTSINFKNLVQYRLINNNGIYKFLNPINSNIDFYNLHPFLYNYTTTFVLYDKLYDNDNLQYIKNIEQLFYLQHNCLLSSCLDKTKNEYFKIINTLNTTKLQSKNIFLLHSINSKYCYTISNINKL